MFAFLYRARGGIVFDDLQKAQTALASAGNARCWISETGDIGLIWTAGTLLSAQDDEVPRSGQPFALALGRLDIREKQNGSREYSSAVCDARRIAACALQKGEAAPNSLMGEFALAHWTGRALFIATDHLGHSSIYYAHTPQGFTVATRLPALLAFPDTPRDLDGLGLALVAMMQMGRGAGHTPFTGIRHLIGGHSLWLDPNRETEAQRWWNPDFSIRRVYKDPRDYTAEIESLFDDAVRSRLPEHGPVGCTLSGGLDSTLVAGFAAPILAETNRNLYAWTSIPHPKLPVESRPGWDNSDWAYASQMGIMHPNIQHQAVSPEGICLLDVLHAVHTSSATPTFNVANHLWVTEIGHRARKAGCNVILTGSHGNPGISFAGNGGITRLIRHGKWLRAIAHLRRTPNFRNRSLIRHTLTAIMGEHTYAQIRQLFGSALPPFSPPGAKLVHPVVREYYPRAPIELSPVVQRRDWMHFLSRPRTSFVVDIMAHAGIEFRDPTADRRLAEYLLGCPTEAFIGDGFERLQARLLGVGRVPDSIRWRRTRGDQVPEQAGFFSLYPERYRDTWAEVRRLPWTMEFIDIPVADNMLEDLVNGKAHPRLHAAALHRILDIGMFIMDAKQRWQVSDGCSYKGI